MNRSKYVCIECFVPSCPNTSLNRPNKVFVHVKECLKKKWCRKCNIDFIPSRRLYCCEDHLNLKEDLENYYYWKLMKGRPRLKRTATLKYLPESEDAENIAAMPSYSGEYKSDTFAQTETSLLEKLLRQPCENLPKLNLENENIANMPSSSGEYKSHTHAQDEILEKLPLQPLENLPNYIPVTKTYHIIAKVNVTTQCDIPKMVDKATYMRQRRNKIMPSMPSVEEYSRSSTTTNSSPTLYSCTTETDSSSKIKIYKKKSGTIKNEMLDLIYENPKMYIGLPKQYLFLISYIVGDRKLNIKEIDIIISLFKIIQKVVL